MAKRRLVVLQSRGSEPDRPPSHWVGFGVVAIVAAWLTLASVAQACLGRLPDAFAPGADLAGARGVGLGFLPAIVHATALSAAAFGGGFLVCRFALTTTARHALASGALAVSMGIAVVALSAPASAAAACAIAIVPLALGGGFAWCGGRVGLSRRPAR